ncbi:MAG: DUF58 domain-containing protein [Anaerolineaceae bacterium]
MITVRRGFWVFVILLTGCILGAAIFGTSLYYRLIYVLAFVLATSFVWTFFSLRGLEIHRYSRTLRHQVGQVFEERFEIINRSRLVRLWLEVDDESPLPGAADSRVLSMIGGRQRRTYVSHRWISRRGLFTLGPTRLRTGDLFGLFAAEKVFPSEDKLLVLPLLVNLSTFDSPPGLLPGGRARYLRTLEVTPYAVGVREYVPGDSLNRIHWQSTARRDRLMVKEFEQDPQADVHLFVDAQRSVQASAAEPEKVFRIDQLWLWRERPRLTLPAMTIEYAVSAAASIAQYYLNHGRAVGLASEGQTLLALTAERGGRQLGKILETLALLQPEGKSSLLGLVTATIGRIPRGSTVVVITPSTQPTVSMAIDMLMQHNMHPILVWIDATTFKGAYSGDRLIQSLTERGIPILRVKNTSDLQEALEGKVVEAEKPWWKVMEPMEVETQSAEVEGGAG